MKKEPTYHITRHDLWGAFQVWEEVMLSKLPKYLRKVAEPLRAGEQAEFKHKGGVWTFDIECLSCPTV